MLQCIAILGIRPLDLECMRYLEEHMTTGKLFWIGTVTTELLSSIHWQYSGNSGDLENSSALDVRLNTPGPV